LQNVVVPEAQNLPAEALEIRGPALIDFVIMLTAVRFDDQLALHTGKVSDTVPDCDLPPKLEAAELPIA
jgi:hypothetical protein